jgi:hypothetical protein
VTQHDHCPAGKPLVVSRHQRAPERCLDSQHLEEVPGDEGCYRGTALDARQVQAAPHPDDISENAGLAAHRLVAGPRESPHIRVVGAGCRPLHGKQLARAPHGIDAKKEHVVDREYHRDEPEAQCHRRDDRQSGERRTTERAERVADVASQVVDDTRAASVATLVGGKRHRAEARDRPGASIDGAQTGGDVLLGLALDVERELLVELAFDTPGSGESAHAQEQIAEIHGHASFITRPMAVDMRSHSPASTASCRRPAEVSR